MDSKRMDQIFSLKFAAKQMQRQAKKSEKEEKSERGKVKKAIEKGNMEGAKIYAQNAIRKKTEQTNYLKFGSQLDAVVSRLQSQANMSMITKNMEGIVKSLDKALASNNMEQVATTMDNFEKQFQSLDVQANYVENAMGNTTALSTPQDQVDLLIQQVADEHNLSLAHSLPNARITMPSSQAVAAGPASTPAQAVGVEVDDSDDLMRRLAELRARK